jgi:hypothetical protein
MCFRDAACVRMSGRGLLILSEISVLIVSLFLWFSLDFERLRFPSLARCGIEVNITIGSTCEIK